MASDLGAGSRRAEECHRRACGLARRRRPRATAGEHQDQDEDKDEDERRGRETPETAGEDVVELECRSITASADAAGERAEVEALLAEWERARRAVVAEIEGFERSFLAVRLPSGHEPTVLHVLRHLVGGAYTMTRYVLHGLDIPPPAKVGLRATDILDVPTFVQASAESATYTHAALALLRDQDLLRPVATRWGKTYTVESLLEHSLVHFLRHRRQLERLGQAVSGRQER